MQRAKQIVESYDCVHDSQQGMQSGDDGVRTGKSPPCVCAVCYFHSTCTSFPPRVHQETVQESSGGPQSVGVTAAGNLFVW